jgi:alpha-D-ribose 1-methylphosphonate 5-phosphate C-P lyase
MGGGPNWTEVTTSLTTDKEETRRIIRNSLLRSLAVREFMCPTCGARPSVPCTVPYSWGTLASRTHDARLTAALLVYNDDLIVSPVVLK